MKKIVASILVFAFFVISFSIMPVSAEVTVENFETFTLDISTQGGGNGFQRLVARKACVPFAVTDGNQLIGLYLNGVATPVSGTGGVFEFQNVALKAGGIRTNATTGEVTGYNLDFPIQSGFDTSGSTSYTYNVTLSREPLEITPPEGGDEGGTDEPSGDITIDNFEPFKLDISTQGNPSSYRQRLVVKASCVPFEITDVNAFVGMYINGTAVLSTGGDTIVFDNVEILAAELDNNNPKLDFTNVDGFVSTIDLKYNYNLTLSRTPIKEKFTAENFEPFKLDVYTQGAPSSAINRICVRYESITFEYDDINVFVGMYLNGTATPSTGGTPVVFENVQIVGASTDTGSLHPKLDFANKEDFDTSGATTYVYNITLSRTPLTDDEEITLQNFEPFKLVIYTQGAGNGFQRFLIKPADFPLVLSGKDELKGFYMNGTATDKNGNVVEFKNVVVTASDAQRSDGDYAVDFAIMPEFDISSASTPYTYNIMLSRERVVPDSNITIENFEPFKLPTTGAFNSPEKVVIAQDQLSNIPFALDSADLLKGCYLNGTATKADGTVIAFEDVEITKSAVRSGGGYELYFAEKTTLGYDSHTWDLTLSRTPLNAGGGDDSGDGGDDNTGDEPQVTVKNFETFELIITYDGGVGSLKRILVSNSNFPFTVTETNGLVGCMLNGKATYLKDDGAYPEVVEFKDVMVMASDVRTSGYGIDFKPPVDMPGTSGYYKFELTLSPEPPPSVDFPEDSSTFFIHPDQFSKTGNWTTEIDSGHYVLYGTGNVLGTASALVVIPEDGTYTVKGYARDYLNDSATYRYMDVEINGVKGERIGDHETAGYVWETIGTYEFKKGDEVKVEIVKAGQWPRLAAICFTTAADYVPKDEKLKTNFELASAKLAFLPLDETKINMLVLPDDFDTDLGTWIEYKDGTYDILRGVVGGASKEATASIDISSGGIYYIWGYSKDNSTSGQGKSSMKLGVNGTVLDGEIGVFGAETATEPEGSYGWDYAGKVWLGKDSKMMLSLVDTSAKGARFAAAMITSDSNFKGISEKRFDTYANDSRFRASVNKEIIDISGVNSYGNKLSFTLKNRTEDPIEEGALIYAVYTKDGKMADIAYTEFEDLGAYSGLEKTEHIFSSTEAWTKGKIMLWDGLGTMKPLVEVQNFTFSEEDKTNPDENAGGDFGTVTDYDIDYVFRNEEYAAKEYNVRSGMKNTIAKLEKGEDVTVAYLGGSITEGNTWRPLTTEWLKKQYPDANITEIKVAMSGTGSDLAACRLDEEVLAYNPDLVFVEYAANSGTEKDVEGIARKLWAHDATADLCIVYVSQTYNFGIYQSGQMPEIPTAFEKVAEHFDIPSIFFVYHPLDLYENDELTLTGKEEGKVLYTTDTIHITKDGGYLAASAIARCILSQAETFDANTYQITNHEIPDDYTLGGTYYPWSEASSSDDWDKMKFTGTWLDCSKDASGNLKNFTHSGGSSAFKLFDNMIGTKTAGSSITIKFKGTDIGIFEAGGQYSGQVKVIIDGVEQPNSWQLYDKNYDSKLRYQYNFYKSLPYGEHTVTFTLDSTMPDKSLLQGRYPSDSTYELNELYIGRILLNGELLDANE